MTRLERKIELSIGVVRIEQRNINIRGLIIALCPTGFYIASKYMPSNPSLKPTPESQTKVKETLLLAPFAGKPACQFIRIPHTPKDAEQSLTGNGVCADTFYFQKPVLVNDVDAYPGHIACDGETKSEIVIPVFSWSDKGKEDCVGVLDLDCFAVGGFGEDDKKGLERVAELVGKSCDWVKSE